MAGLILDSSTDTLVLALTNTGGTGKWETHDEAARIGSNLFPILEAFVPQNISYIAVGRGPGSYTGTRAAVAAATGFSQGADIPLILFPSLLLFLPEGDAEAILEIKGSKDFYILECKEGAIHERRGSPSGLPAVQAPFRFQPEAAIPRIAAWVEGKRYAKTPSVEAISYLHQLI